MSNFSTDVSSCRVDFFKSTGKWYATESVVFPGDTYDKHPTDALKSAIRTSLPNKYVGMTAVCLHPYVDAQFPVMITVE